MENTNIKEYKGNILAMYDVRGIQSYIFRTNKIKDAMGASEKIDNIIMDALQYAVNKIGNLNCLLEWDDYLKQGKSNPDAKELRFLNKEKNIDIQVLFIGGGNAFVCFKTGDLYLKINKKMSKYILDETYSLQLAAAAVPMTYDYTKDYQDVHNEMNRIKADMSDSKPVGVMPIIKAEKTTGLPVSNKKANGVNVSTEIYLKKEYKRLNTDENKEEKLIDNLVLQKGVDSLLAVIHMDGNNMGLRIRKLMSDSNMNNYSKAVDRMRKISFNINNSYKETFNDMKKEIILKAKESSKFKNKKNEIFFRRIITAGDDITFVCNASVALSAVEYYSKKISEKALFSIEELSDKKISENKLKFSVCAGIAFINGHFPFSTAYQVAEACCDSAKLRAKVDKNKENGNIGNWVDFQICKNVQTQDLDATRKREYMLPDGENLLLRPYHIHTCNTEIFDDYYDFDKFKKRFHLFSDMERSSAKNLRNTYSDGYDEMNNLINFYKSRDKKMPENEEAFSKDKDTDKELVATWYDALEMLDYYEDYLEN